MLEITTFIDLQYDFSFKKIFLDESDPTPLISFINSMLPDHFGPVTDIQFSPSEHFGNNPSAREIIFDVFCHNQEGEKFIIEMQRSKQAFFMDRIVFYASTAIVEQGIKGEWNYQLTPVFVICLLDFVMNGRNNPMRYFRDAVLTDYWTKEIIFDKLHLLIVELPIFAKSINELATDRDKWIYIFKYLKTLKEQPAELKGSVFDKVFERARFLNLTKMEQNYYRECINSKNDYRNVMAYAKEEGFAEGEAKGKAETKIELAHKLKEAGVDLSIIQSVTGFSEEELSKL